MRSAYYRKLAQLAADVDQLYKDLLQNDAASNIRKYYNMFMNFIRKKYADFDEYRKLNNLKKCADFKRIFGLSFALTYLEAQLGEIGTKIMTLWDRFKNLSYVQDVRNCFSELSRKVRNSCFNLILKSSTILLII